MDVKLTAIHDDIRIALGSPRKDCSHGRSASSCSTGHGDPATTFPDAHADAAVAFYFGKLNVTAIGESLVLLQNGTVVGNAVNLIRENHVMRISHRHKGSFG